MREEESTSIAKRVKGKRGHECDVYEKCLDIHPNWPNMRTHTNEKPYEVMRARSFRNSSHLKITCVRTMDRETVRM